MLLGVLPTGERNAGFEFVRDIPYGVGPHEPEEVAAQGTGDRKGKSRLLADLFLYKLSRVDACPIS